MVLHPRLGDVGNFGEDSITDSSLESGLANEFDGDEIDCEYGRAIPVAPIRQTLQCTVALSGRMMV